MDVKVQHEDHEPKPVPVTVKKTIPVDQLLRTCDRCGPAVQAYVRIMVKPSTDTYLDLCGHCYHQHEDKLKFYALEDNRSALAQK